MVVSSYHWPAEQPVERIEHDTMIRRYAGALRIIFKPLVEHCPLIGWQRAQSISPVRNRECQAICRALSASYKDVSFV